MNAIIKLILLSIVVILLGTFLMYILECNRPDSEINYLENSLWWCISITTVVYGDIVPVTKLGRAVAILYGFWNFHNCNFFIYYYK
ncbi:MAG: ion channel [Nitrososphaeraceae archaeon]